MRRKFNFTLFVLAYLLAAPAIPSRADELAGKGREIFQKNQHAVVTVQEVLKISRAGSSRASETKQDLTGTVLDASGLTVLALSACDPGELYQRMAGDESSRNKLDTEVTDMKILLDDGTEVPAEIVLRDKDLDLAFIRPKAKPASPMTSVDLTKCGSAQLLDQVITLNRLNSAAGRAYSASVERITAVIQKPRTFYIPDSTMTTTTPGSPAFSLDGNLLGVFVVRSVNSKGGSAGNYRENLTSIILPAEDIVKAAKQAPEAKGDSEKKEAPKDPKDQKPEK